MENVKKKHGFASGLGFVFAAAGSAVGLGNLWAFPNKAAKYGGAAFVLVYIISVILIGTIVMIADTHIGRRAQANPISAYQKANKKLGWFGMFAIIIPFIITAYYTVLGGYTVKYTLNSFNQNSTVMGSFAGNIPEVIMFTGIFIVLALIVVMGGIKNGIEKASKILMPALFVILLLIVIYALTLGEGVKEGLSFYILKLDFKTLGFEGVLAAMSQAFFSLSLGMGIMVSYGSYTGKDIKIGKSTIYICVFDLLVALLAGFAIFPALYHYQAVNPGASLKDSGLLLLFQSLPLVFDGLGVVGQIVSCLFFGMVVIAALTSVISLFEVITQFIIQKFKVRRKKAILVVAILCFCCSIPIGISLGYEVCGVNAMKLFGQNLLDFFDQVTNNVLMPICAFGSCLVIGWFIDKKFTFNPIKTCKALYEDGLQVGKFGKFFAVMVKYVTPLLILVVEIFGVRDLICPKTACGRVFSTNGLAVVLTAVIIIGISIAIYFMFFKNKNNGTNEDELLLEEKALAKK